MPLRPLLADLHGGFADLYGRLIGNLGSFAPARTPAEIVQRLNAQVTRYVQTCPS